MSKHEPRLGRESAPVISGDAALSDTEKNIVEALLPESAGAESKPAVAEPGGVTLTYGELAAGVARFANALRKTGVAEGDRVSVQVEKSIANLLTYLACLKIGAVYNPLNTGYEMGEVRYFIDNAEPRLIVASAKRAGEIADTGIAGGNCHLHTMEADGTGSLADLANAQSDDAQTAPVGLEALAALIYTSGTTGRSKGAMLSHTNLLSNARTLLQCWAFEPGDVLLHALPIYHVHGLMVALHTALLNRSKLIWLARFDADAVIDQLPGATVMMGVPTFYTRLLDHPRFSRACCLNMRLFISGSAPLLSDTHRAFERHTGHAILERYGMSEAGMITTNPYGGARVPGTVGFALPDVSVRIAGGDGAPVADGEIGVLEAKGPNIFKGYWRMPEKTAEEFRSDGYFITGDQAVRDAQGRITLVGRAKDMIISGGLNIYPKEVEAVIDEVEGVCESAVVGVPHPDFGEAAVAVIAASTGDHEALARAVLAYLKGRIARFKQPKRVFIIEELPRNTMGKVQKAALRERYKDSFHDAG